MGIEIQIINTQNQKFPIVLYWWKIKYYASTNNNRKIS